MLLIYGLKGNDVNEKKHRMSNILSFSTKNNFSGMFAWVWLKFIFHWKGHFMILHKSLFDTLAEMLWIIENKDVSSTNNWVFDDGLSARLLIQTRNRKEPKMDSWRAPALTPFKEETWSFKVLICFLSFKKSDKILRS